MLPFIKSRADQWVVDRGRSMGMSCARNGAGLPTSAWAGGATEAWDSSWEGVDAVVELSPWRCSPPTVQVAACTVAPSPHPNSCMGITWKDRDGKGGAGEGEEDVAVTVRSTEAVLSVAAVGSSVGSTPFAWEGPSSPLTAVPSSGSGQSTPQCEELMRPAQSSRSNRARTAATRPTAVSLITILNMQLVVGQDQRPWPCRRNT
jgi:hypothetical protein